MTQNQLPFSPEILKTLVFVCQANLNRSPLCEGLAREEIRSLNLDLVLKCTSAGISGYHKGEPANRFVHYYFDSRAIPFSHRVKSVFDLQLSPGDILVAVDRSCYNDLMEFAEQKKLILFLLRQFETSAINSDIDSVADLPDPQFAPHQTYELFEKLAEKCKPCITNLLDWLESKVE